MLEEHTPVCVIGAGTMGRGIAQVAVAAGHPVTLVDPDQRQLDAAVDDITGRLFKKDPQLGQLVGERLTTARSVSDVRPWPGTMAIEAVVEELAVKHRVLGESLAQFGAECILATNTSSLSITEIAAGVAAPARVVGMHFFNPVPAMRLVEVVEGLQTDPDVADTVARVATSWGKRVARVRSAPGFIVNRVARAFYGEALRLVEERVATPEVIDELLRSAGFRMGPFELMDLIGVEVNLAVTRTVWQAFNYDPRFTPSLIQSELVAAGRLGRKSGHGFYRYGDGAERPAARPVEPVGAAPSSLILHGRDAQLEALAWRAGISSEVVEPDGYPWAALPGGGAVVVTRGRSAQQESLELGRPVAVLDRCLDAKQVSGLAFASSNDAVGHAAAAWLDVAGVAAYRIADSPGLAVGRILSMIANEAWEAVHTGVATRGDVDAAMVLGTNYPMGPFEWCEAWGSPVVLETLDSTWANYRDPRYRASVGLRAEALASVGSGLDA